MPLSDKVRVARAFQRSVRIDADISNPSSLDGFVCPPSSATALQVMARHISDTVQAAFTWTGPYGAGKSSLAVALGAALDCDEAVRNRAAQALGEETISDVWEAMPPRSKGWRILPVVGSRTRPAQAIGEAIVRNRMRRATANTEWSEQETLDALDSIARREPRKRGGLLVIIDEMGKFLESAAYDGTDIYFFQELAELASRSSRRLVVVGALHQAFEEYANGMSREIRDAWAKIQGRFMDLAINASAEEQLMLLGRAIQFDEPERDIAPLAAYVSELTGDRAQAILLEQCWPLHPIVACLLGPISRRRFGQNQRSLFGFLNSAETEGFQDFLRRAENHELYTPPRLWDYLRLNMEPSIMASSDGHRWSMATDTIERCRAKGGDDLHIGLLQTIALLDLFKERSGVSASELAICLALSDDFDADKVKSALSDLQKWAMVIYREFSGSYGIYEGSDFDIDAKLDVAYRSFTPDFQNMWRTGELQPIFAKRHYHRFGALRWYDVMVSSLSDVDAVVADCLNGTRLSEGSAGVFILAMPTDEHALNSGAEEAACAALAQAEDASVDIAVGIPSQSNRLLPSLVRELQALEWISENTSELRGDSVARAEVHSRITSAAERIGVEFERAIGNSVWHFITGDERRLGLSDLIGAASDIADKRFSKSPRVFNELLNRIKSSSSAAAGRNALLRCMIANEGQERLGIKGYPAEGGLFDSLLYATGLYRKINDAWTFVIPKDDEGNFCHLWNAAEELLKSNSNRAVTMQEIYAAWRKVPYGVKDGILPVLATAFLMSHKRDISFYRGDVFQSGLTEIDAEVISRTPQDIAARWMGDYRIEETGFWAGITDAARELSTADIDEGAEPIEVARALVAAYDALPRWTERTGMVSNNAKRVRRILKDAYDPNKVIFDGIAGLAKRKEAAAEVVKSGMLELQDAYPKMLEQLRQTLLGELGVTDESRAIADLRSRAENICGLSGDHRLESFIMRIVGFDMSEAVMEELASLSINKPPRQWTDFDIDRAALELAGFARSFKSLETFAHVKGRQDRRHAIAIAVGAQGTPSHEQFEITDADQVEVDALVKNMLDSLQSPDGLNRNIVLAALAEVSAQFINAHALTETENKE